MGDEERFAASGRELVSHPRYVSITLVWYLATLTSGGLAALTIFSFYDSGGSPWVLAIEIGAAIITVTGIVAPAVVGLVLKRQGDPAAGMTASALVMLGHVMILSGPLFLATPIVSRYFAIARHNSGGY